MASPTMSHWHNVYKISLGASSIEEDKLNNSEEDAAPVKVFEKRLSLLGGNLPIEEETILREFLTPKINRDELPTNSVVTTLGNNFMADKSNQVYYKVVNVLGTEDKSNVLGTEDKNIVLGAEDKSNVIVENDVEVVQFVICFIVSAMSGLELFQEDLDNYCNELSPYLDKSMEATDISEYLACVDAWYEKNICFVQRCLDYFSCQLAALMCVGFCSDSVVVSPNAPEEAQADIERFLACCNLSTLFLEPSDEPFVSCYSSSSLQDMANLSNAEVVNIEYDEEGIFLLQTTKTTTFCKECVDILLHLKTPNPIQMRQVVENYKLKSIQQMNSFQRMIKAAETDYYMLYKTFLFLVSSGNVLVVLHHAKLHTCIGSNDSSRQVIEVLEQFLDGLGGLLLFDTAEDKQKFKVKFDAFV